MPPRALTSITRYRMVIAAATPALPARQRVTHELTERLQHPPEQRSRRSPRPKREHQPASPPFNVPRTDRYHDEREPAGAIATPRIPRTPSRRLGGCGEVHGSKLTGPAPAAQLRNAHFTRRSLRVRLGGAVSFVASAAVRRRGPRRLRHPFPDAGHRALPPRSRWAAKPVAVREAPNGLRAVQKAFDLLLPGGDTSTR